MAWEPVTSWGGQRGSDSPGRADKVTRSRAVIPLALPWLGHRRSPGEATLWETVLTGKNPVEDQQAGGGVRSASRGPARRSRVSSPRPAPGEALLGGRATPRSPSNRASPPAQGAGMRCGAHDVTS